MPLVSNPVDLDTLEHSVWLLWEEWLRGYFDGQPHTVSHRTRSCPAAFLSFQQSSLQVPLDGLGIHMVWIAPSRQQVRWDAIPGTQGRRVSTSVRWTFLVRARLEAQPGEQAALLAMEGASLLHWLLRSPLATASLAQKGITHVRPEFPVLISEVMGGFALRQMGCGATLDYWI